MCTQRGGNYWGSILAPNFIATVKPSPALLRVSDRKSGLRLLSSYMLVHPSVGVDLCLEQTLLLSSSNPNSSGSVMPDIRRLPSSSFLFHFLFFFTFFPCFPLFSFLFPFFFSLKEAMNAFNCSW